MRTIRPLPGARRVDFSRTKYGVELAIDARFISQLPAFDPSDGPHYLTYYDMTLITKGRGTVAIDDQVEPVAPGTVFFSRPGRVRRLRLEAFDGACVFFTDDFVRDAFADRGFLEQFAYFAPGRPPAFLALTAAQRATFLRRFQTMDREFVALRGDAPAFLRAALYELLVMLNRWYLAAFPDRALRARHAIVERFAALVEREFSASLTVDRCAAALGVTPGHLGLLCRTYLGCPPGRYIGDRVVQEARRLLMYTSDPAAQVAYRLGFADPAYFGRCFRRATGLSPMRFRAQQRGAQTRSNGVR